MTQVRKISKHFLGQFAVGSKGILGCPVMTDHDVSAVDLQRCSPAVDGGDVNDSFISRRIVPLPRSIGAAFGWRCDPKVVPAVVRLAAILVVYKWRVFIGNQFPDDAVQQKSCAVDRYPDVSRTVWRACGSSGKPRVPRLPVHSGIKVFSRSPSPCDNAGIWVVVQTLAQIRLMWQGVGSHLASSASRWLEVRTPRPGCLASHHAITFAYTPEVN